MFGLFLCVVKLIFFYFLQIKTTLPRSGLAECQSIEKEFLSGTVHWTLPGGTYLIYRYHKSFNKSFDENLDERFDERFGDSFDESFSESFGENYKFLI